MHVFLSYNTRDKAEVERLGHALLERGVRPWLDKWELVAGKPWLDEVARAIHSANAVCACIGAAGVGRVQAPEIRVALDAAFADPERLVIPVLLPSARQDLEIPAFLKERTWVDLRGSLSWTEGVERIAHALEGRGVGPRLRGDSACPYRGLEAFREEHARMFFGRADEVSTCLEGLRARPLLTLIGASGSGKSSLVHAGIIPAVRTGELDDRFEWSVISLRPGPQPLHELALWTHNELGYEGRPSFEKLKEVMASDGHALRNAIDQEMVRRGDARLLLVIDQLEELFTQGADAQERAAFLRNVLFAGTAPGARAKVVLTLRADFLGACLQESAIEADLRASASIIGPMSVDQLQEAIERPAIQAGAEIDRALTIALADAVKGQPGDLPLLEFALERLWAEKTNAGRNRLTGNDLDAIGGVRGAIAKHADAIVAKLDVEHELPVVRKMFRRLVQLGEGAPDTRRRATRTSIEAIDSRARELLDRFIAARLITAVVAKSEETSEAELAHDALIREWATLTRWIEDRAALRIEHELERAAEQWAPAADPGDLWRGARLRRALELRASGAIAPVGASVRFLDASDAAVRAAEMEEETRRKRELEAAKALAESSQTLAGERKTHADRLRKMLWVMGALFIVAIVAGLAAVNRWTAAERELAASLEEHGRGELLEGHAGKALAFLAEAYRLNPQRTSTRFLIAGAAQSLELVPLKGHSGAVRSIAFSDDGRRVVTAGDDRTVRIWDSAGRPMTSFAVPNIVRRASFSPDETRVLTLDVDGTAVVWDLASSRPIAVFDRFKLTSARFDPSGTRVLTASGDASARVWDAASAELLTTIVPNAPRLSTIGWRKTAGFSPDGMRIVTISEGLAQMWDVVSGKLIGSLRRPLPDPEYDSELQYRDEEGREFREDPAEQFFKVDAARFSANSARLAIWSRHEKEVDIWDVKSARHLSTIQFKKWIREWVDSVDLSPRGDRIVLYGTDDVNVAVEVQEIESGRPLASLGLPPDKIDVVRFFAEGQRVVTTSRDGALRLWDASSGERIAFLDRDLGRFKDLAVSAESTRIGIATRGGAYLWEPGSVVLTPSGPKGRDVAVFNPDGSQLLIGSETWNVKSRVHLHSLEMSGEWVSIRASLSAAKKRLERQSAYDPSGTRLVTATGGNPSWISVWDTASGRCIHTFDMQFLEYVSWVSFNSDGRRVFAAGEGGASRI